MPDSEWNPSQQCEIVGISSESPVLSVRFRTLAPSAPCCLLLPRRHRHPGLHCFRRSNTSPVRFPINASRTASRQCPAHDSGSVWIAILHCNGLSPSTSCRSSRRTAAQWLAYALPCRRFADTLTDAYARLGADVDRYSFIVVDFHHLLLAGLPAHQL